MGRKAKVSYEEKIKACEDCLSGVAAATQAADGPGINARTFEKLIKRYRTNGTEPS